MIVTCSSIGNGFLFLANLFSFYVFREDTKIIAWRSIWNYMGVAVIEYTIVRMSLCVLKKKSMVALL